MKTIRKLSINPEKVIRNEELVNLRGGYPGGGCTAGPKGDQHWICCVDGSAKTFMSSTASGAESACEGIHGSGNCDCEEN